MASSSRKPNDSTPRTTEEQTKRLRRVDELVQEAEKTLQKIRAQHERYQKQTAEGTSPINSFRSNAEQKVPDVERRVLEGLYMRSIEGGSASSSASDVSVGLKTPSDEDSAEDDEEVAVINLGENTPSPRKEVKDVNVATVSTPLRDEAVSVRSEDLVTTRSVGITPSRDYDEGKHLRTERRVSFAGNALTTSEISRETQTTTPFTNCECQQQTDENQEPQPKLQLQKMPRVDIKGGMTIQNLQPIEIPSRPTALATLRTNNIHYEEVTASSESKTTQTESKLSSSGTVTTSSQQSLLRIASQGDGYEEVDKEREPQPSLVVKEEEVVHNTFVNPFGLQSDLSVEAKMDGKGDEMPQRRSISEDLLRHINISDDESNPPKESQETTDIHKNQQVQDHIISVLDQIIEMRVTTDDESSKSASVVTEDMPVKPHIEDLRQISTQYSLKSSASSYEVIDASTQVSSSLLQPSIDSDGSGGGDVNIRFSKEWREVVFRGLSDDEAAAPSKKKVASGQSPQDMIEILKKAVKEGNVKAQESIKDFFQPTPEDIQSIRRASLHFSKFGRKRETSDVEISKNTASEQPSSSEVSECFSFLQSAQIDDTKTTAISSSPHFPKSLEKFVTPTPSMCLQDKALNMEELKKQESCIMYESMAPLLPSKTILTASEDKIVQSIQAPLKIHPNGRYADEAEDFYQQSPPSPTKRGGHHRQCHTDTTATSESISESLSEGEVKCKCDASIGELHLCKYARNIKGRVQYLKRNPGKLLKYEMAEPDLEVMGQKRHYFNWVSYYVKRPAAT